MAFWRVTSHRVGVNKYPDGACNNADLAAHWSTVYPMILDERSRNRASACDWRLVPVNGNSTWGASRRFTPVSLGDGMWRESLERVHRRSKLNKDVTSQYRHEIKNSD